jgi:phosphoglycerate dehydrogenase-like enzyme
VQTRAARSGNVIAMTNENASSSQARSKRQVVVTFSAAASMRQAFDEALDAVADITYLDDVGQDERRRALASADAVLAWNVDGELQGPVELRLLESAGFVQLVLAGVDGVSFDRIPEGVAVASNAGAYAKPMAEHVLALTLSLAKHLPQNDAKMRRGEFDQQTPNREIRGSVVGVLGFGGIGQASARLFRAFGARIHAVNHSGHTDEPVDWIGTLRDLDAVLAATDVLVVSIPLTRETRGLIGERELSLMKPDAIFVNVARASIVVEDALYEHLRSTPRGSTRGGRSRASRARLQRGGRSWTSRTSSALRTTPPSPSARLLRRRGTRPRTSRAAYRARLRSTSLIGPSTLRPLDKCSLVARWCMPRRRFGSRASARVPSLR